MDKMKRGFRRGLARLHPSPAPPITLRTTVSTSALAPLQDEDLSQPLRPVSAGGSAVPTPLQPPPANIISLPHIPAPPPSSNQPSKPNNPAPTIPKLPASVPQLVVSTEGVVNPATSTSAILSASGLEPQASAPPPSLMVAPQEPGPTVSSTLSRPPSAPHIPQLAVSAVESASDISALNPILSSAPDIVLPLSQHTITSGIPAPPISEDTEPSLWQQAFNKLSDSDKAVFPFSGIDIKDNIEKILEATTKSRSVCQENRWKFTFRGKDIIVRDVADKVLVWVEKFKTVGDTIVQFDPVHAALPWAGVRLLLQIAVNNHETMAAVLIGVETIARLLVRCAVYERLYLKSPSELSVRKSLEDALGGLYSAVLEFLAFAQRYLDKPSAKRMLHGVLDAEGGSCFASIGERESYLVKELTAAEAEVRRQDHTTLKGHSEKLRAILEEMEKPIMRIDSNVKLLYDNVQGYIEDQKRGKILDWLSQIEYMKHHQKAKEGLLDNTGQWLFNREQYREWRSSSASGILWLRGIPGAGKTKLTCMVIHVLKSLLQGYEPVVYFYCNRNESQRRDPTVLMQAIVKQLSLVFSGLPKPVVAEYDTRVKHGLAAGSLSFQESCDLVAALLDIYPQTTIIIDALDESDPDERWRLLEALKTIIHSSSNLVKIFVSSRDDTDIKLELGQVPNLYINARESSGDIARFARREVTQAIAKRRLLRGNVTNELKEQIIATIAEGAKGMFQWADLQIKNLYKMKFEDDIRKNLGKLPASLEETYSQIWNEILQGTALEKEVTRKALVWIMCSRQLFNREAWAEASYWPAPVPIDGIDTLFDLCRNLVIWDHQLDRVVFAHLSVQEYLETRVFSIVDANSIAAEACLSFFNSTTQWTAVDGAIIPSPAERRFVVYSTAYWADHVESSYDRQQHMSKQLYDLLQHFLGSWAKPGQGYCRWLQIAGVLCKDPSNPPETYQLRSILPHLEMIPPNPLFALSYFSFGVELKQHWEHGSFDVNCKNSVGETLLLVASGRGNEWVSTFLLANGADVNAGTSGYTRNPLMAAIRGGHGATVANLLDHGADVSANDGHYMTVMDAALQEGKKAVMETILARDTSIEITEDILKDVAGNRSNGKEIMEALLASGGNLKITEAVLRNAVTNKTWGKQMIGMLLAKDANIRITEGVVMDTAWTWWAQPIMEILLARDPNIEITKSITRAASINSHGGMEMMEMLLAKEPTAVIATPVVEAIVGTFKMRMLEVLLARDGGIEVTEELVTAAAGNQTGDQGVIEMLLARDPNIKITEGVVVAAAGNGNKEILEMLLARDAGIGITEAVVAAAAGSRKLAAEIVEMLLVRDPRIKITESTMKAAAGNLIAGKRVVEMLLAKDPTIEITKDVMNAATNGYRGGQDIIPVLLARNTTIKITEDVMTAAAKYWSSKHMTELLLARDPSLKTTEAVLTAAASNPFYGQQVVEMLLAGDENIKITESVVKAAAGNSSGGGKAIMELLFARDSSLKVTEEIVAVAAGNSSNGIAMMEMLLARDADIKVTEAIKMAAKGNRSCGARIMKMLHPRARLSQAETIAPKPQSVVEVEVTSFSFNGTDPLNPPPSEGGTNTA